MIRDNYKLNKKIYKLNSSDFISEDIYLLYEYEYVTSRRSDKLNKEDPDDYTQGELQLGGDALEFLFGKR